MALPPPPQRAGLFLPGEAGPTLPPLTPEECIALRGEVDALSRALAEERYRHVAGHEPEPALTPLFRRHGRAAHRDIARRLDAAGEPSLAAQVRALRAERAQAASEEAWRAAEARARVPGPDGPVSASEAALGLLRETRRDRRAAFGSAYVEVALSLVDRERGAEERARARAEVGLTPPWEAVVEGDTLLSATDDAYADLLRWLAAREGLAPAPRGDLTRADLLGILALRRWEGLFPRGMLAVELARLAGELRLPLERVRIDERTANDGPAEPWPGAHAFETRVAFRRCGGAIDWEALLGAVGAALAAAAVPPHRRPAELGASAGALLAGLLRDPGFLQRRLGVERRDVADLRRALGLRALFRLRAAAASLRVAAEVERGTTGSAWYEAHRAAMSGAARASWPAGLAPRDADAAAQLALLRGWARAAKVRQSLVERCDEDWWRNPRSAEPVAAALAGAGPGHDGAVTIVSGAEALLACF